MKDNIKKIAFYIGSLERGGAERVIVNLAEYFQKEGYKVYVVTKLKEADEYALSDGIIRVVADLDDAEETKSRIQNLYLRVHKLRKVWKEIKPDIIVSFIRKNNVMAIASSRCLKIPVVVSVRSNPKRELSGFIMKKISFFLFGLADGIVLQTNQAKEFFPKFLQKKVIILPNSLNTAFLNFPKLSEEKKEIVTVGRIDENKNQSMLVKAFGEIAAIYPDWVLKLYGNGEKKEELESYVKTKRLENQIIFMGEVSDIQNRIKDSAIFVLPSKQEGMPNALIEAMTLGLAVISTDCPCGGPADLITDGENGILIPVDDSKELKNSLEKLMDDSNYRNKIGEDAIKIVERLHPDIVNKMWKEYLEKLL